MDLFGNKEKKIARICTNCKHNYFGQTTVQTPPDQGKCATCLHPEKSNFELRI